MLGYDVETTGNDVRHGCLPFSFQFANEEVVHYFEADVDPLTRVPSYTDEMLASVIDILCSDEIVLHNAKYDCKFTAAAIRHQREMTGFKWDLDWLWDGIQDTYIACHVHHNIWPKGLKPLVQAIFLYDNHFQTAIRNATVRSRRIARLKRFREWTYDTTPRRHHPTMRDNESRCNSPWRIAAKADPHWPGIIRDPKDRTKSGGDGWWYSDMWLPGSIFRLAPDFLPPAEECNPDLTGGREHPWKSVLKNYAINDVIITPPLWEFYKKYFDEEDKWNLYSQRHELLRITYDMEESGVTLKPQTQIEGMFDGIREKANHHRS